MPRAAAGSHRDEDETGNDGELPCVDSIVNNSLMETLSTTEGAVLGLVALGERSGYDLALVAEDSVQHLWTPSRSQIYKTLPRLVAAGLARKREVEQQGRPDKALYRISSSGRAALRSWLDEVEDEPANGRIVFPLKLFFCEFASAGTAQAQLSAYRRFLERRLERYEGLRDGPPRFESAFPRHVLHHGLARVRATLAWIEETEEALVSVTTQASRA
jgi:PadR family transcriptional regulator, regulatory protein AphA